MHGDLQVVNALPDGTRIASEVGLRDIARALQEGDRLKGWEGDPDMIVCVDLITGMFDVWTRDNEGAPYIAFSRPYCDGRLIDDALACDTRRRDVAGEVLVRNKAVDAAARAAFEAETEEAADKLRHGLLRDIGPYEVGLTRTLFPVSGGIR